MDKLLLVFYVGENYFTEDHRWQEVNNSIKELMKNLNKGDNDIITFILPNGSLHPETIKVECINPKIVDNTTYSFIKEKLERLEKEIQIQLNAKK